MVGEKKEHLGRRILDLIEENEVKMSENEEIYDLDISLIKPNPEQPRTFFDEQSLKELADSIDKHGIIQPIITRPMQEGYIVVAGERRLRASKMLGKQTIPAIIRDYNAIYLAELAILENLQREELSPIEEALAYTRIIKNLSISHAELAKKIGKSRSYVTNLIGLIGLPERVIRQVNEKKLSMGHARVLSKLKNENLIKSLADDVIKNQMNVRDLEKYVKKNKSDSSPTRQKYVSDEQIRALKKLLERNFSVTTQVWVQGESVKINFGGKDEMKQFIDKLIDDYDRNSNKGGGLNSK